ncbi:hypothetical protein PIB30_054165 [Stylosanthes scabra]|uniref:Aminotransferase-like plant mobile domain-containing protein n=1 Tax=Stylosanthes scabra TaxID=79078 RepID=A0ABU6TKS6_9FABA|nr:hypothetical protein [Stylosanthes scabra]
MIGLSRTCLEAIRLYQVARLNDHWFKVDESLDVAYQFGLPIDGEAVSGCLKNFQIFMREQGGRLAWVWFRELSGQLPPPQNIDGFTISYSWFQKTFSVLPHDAGKETVMIYARAYIMMLLETQLFGDKSGARLHIRWLPFVATRVPDVPDRRRADRRMRVGTCMSQRDDGDGAERVRRAQFRPLGQRRPRGRGRVSAGTSRGEGIGVPSHLYPNFVSPSTMERQLGGEVCYSYLAAIWAQEDSEVSSSHDIVGASDPPPAVPQPAVHYPPPEVPQPAVQAPREDEDETHMTKHKHLCILGRTSLSLGTSFPSVASNLAQSASLGMVWVDFIHVGPNARTSSLALLWFGSGMIMGPPYGGQ